MLYELQHRDDIPENHLEYLKRSIDDDSFENDNSF